MRETTARECSNRRGADKYYFVIIIFTFFVYFPYRTLWYIDYKDLLGVREVLSLNLGTETSSNSSNNDNNNSVALVHEL
jgi:hypothetical protein